MLLEAASRPVMPVAVTAIASRLPACTRPEDGYLDPLGQGVFPQGHHRVRRRLTRPHGDQRGRRSGQGQLVHQRRRPAVQQVRVAVGVGPAGRGQRFSRPVPRRHRGRDGRIGFGPPRVIVRSCDVISDDLLACGVNVPGRHLPGAAGPPARGEWFPAARPGSRSDLEGFAERRIVSSLSGRHPRSAARRGGSGARPAPARWVPAGACR